MSVGPVLRLEIVIAEGCAKELIVYEGQTVEQIADDFTRLHNLPVEARERICSSLSATLNKLNT